MMLRVLYLFFILSVSGVSYANKDSCLVIKETQWNKISKDKNYTETYASDDDPEVKTNKEVTQKTATDLGALKYVFYFLVAGAILFLVVKILLNINSSPVVGSGNDRVYTLSEVEEKMLEIDLDKILADTLATGDFRLALRINFLIIIKMLSLKGKINWTKEKTNWEYFAEIKDKEIAQKFNEIVVPFETIWYGERTLTESQFNRLALSYEMFKKQLA